MAKIHSIAGNKPTKSITSDINSAGNFVGIIKNQFKQVKRLNEKNFSREVRKIANKTNCKFLFDVPRVLMDQKSGFVAALLSFCEEEPKLYFVTISGSRKSIVVVEQKDAPKQLVNFAWSFANVLSLVGTIDAAQMVKNANA